MGAFELVLVIQRRFMEEVEKHSTEVFPMEACGILVGVRDGDLKTVMRLYRAQNVFASPYSYQVDPEEQYRVFVEAETIGLEVIGFYHSHPKWSAEPSEVDRNMAFYPGLSYLIYSMLEREFKSYMLSGAELKLEPLQCE